MNVPTKAQQVFCSITPEFYREAARLLTDRLGPTDYFSGSLRFTCGEWDCCLVLSLLVYRRTERAPDGVSRPLTDLVPVWWEFHTTGPEGEALNDFSFAELKEYTIP